MKLNLSVALLLGALLTSGLQLFATELELVATTDLPGVSGDMDHLAIDTGGQRLFVAAEDNGTVRVIDLKTRKVLRTLKGFETPHSILFLPDQKELYVTDGSKSVKVLDSDTFQVKKTVSTTPGADSIGVDRTNHRLYAVTGGKDVKMTTSAISEIDTHQGKLLKELPISAAHVEAMAVESPGPRLYVNVTDKNYLAVIDRETGKLIAQWHISEARQNAPLACNLALTAPPRAVATMPGAMVAGARNRWNRMIFTRTGAISASASGTKRFTRSSTPTSSCVPMMRGNI